MANNKATGARTVRFKKLTVKNYSAFTLLELLLTASVSLILIFIISEILVLNYKITIKTDKYHNAITSDQYLYWFFYNQITENIGLKYFEEENIEKGLKQFLLVKQIETIKIFTTNEVLVEKKLPERVRFRLAESSNVLQISNLNMVDNNLEVEECLYYVASAAVERKQQYSLYQYKNGQSEELVRGIVNMSVEQINLRDDRYFIFKFIGQDDFNNFSFVIPDAIKA